MNTVTTNGNIKELYEFGDIFKSFGNHYYILSRNMGFSDGCNLVNIHDGQILNAQTELLVVDQNYLYNYLDKYGLVKVPKHTKITITCNE